MGATLVMEAAGLSLGFRTAEDFDEGPPDPEPQPGLVALPGAPVTNVTTAPARHSELLLFS